jgi:hypothetical protein
MATVRTGEFSKYSNRLIDDLKSMHVWLWDTGPTEPELPEPPDPPSGKQGDPKFDLANIQFQRKLIGYRGALEKYERDVAEFKQWSSKNGGPVAVMFWSTDATSALKSDARAVAEGRQGKPRWYRDLPPSMKPGHGHRENVERHAAGREEMLAAMKSDPVFGDNT